MKIAAAAYPIDWHNRWNDYVGKLRVWVRTASENGAELLVFPEYAALELASLAREENASDLQRSIEAISARLKDVDELQGSLAREFRMHICAASGPVRREGGGAVNRVRLFAADGSSATQDKLILTRFERDEWGLAAGGALRVFDTAIGRIAVLLGKDCAFPLIARAASDAGAEILLVPGFSASSRGYWRTRIAAMARAQENCCVVVQATAVGEARWLPAAGRGVGAAAIYAAPAEGLCEEGLIAAGKMNAPGWVYGEVSLEVLRKVRAERAAFDAVQWAEQDTRLVGVEMLALGREPAQSAGASG